jgi:DNA ligase D-like protein (predicted 3'-phosphoesterase)
MGVLFLDGKRTMNKKSLNEYKKKRDFRKTPEPSGDSKQAGDGRVFVIQKHDASSLHYDFRIEVDGVLKSWAVPKGPSTDPRDKRLAVMTEDHPMEYRDFEGVIPKGEYGGGTVMVWDSGTYKNLKTDNGHAVAMSKCIENGQVEIELHGKKLMGGYALRRFKGDKQWLLIKMKDEHADARRNPVSTEPDSVKSGKSLKAIAGESGDS